MKSKKNSQISMFGQDQSDILFKRFVLQKLCPGKFLIEDSWPYDELDDEDIEAAGDVLRALMPLDTIVTDMWDWDIHFEEKTFEETYFDVALGQEEYALTQAEYLKDDLMQWIDEMGMDYAQEEFSGDEFEKWVLEQCLQFVQKWRENIVKKFSEYPKIDRSKFIPERHRDASYCEGTFKDGRPFRVECWFEQGFTFLTYFIPTLGIENADAVTLKKLLVSEGVIHFHDDKFREAGHSGLNIEVEKGKDHSDNEIWILNVMVGDEDSDGRAFITDHCPLKKYEFPYEEVSKPEEYFIALCEEEGKYYAYFINNSNESIEMMLENEKFEQKEIGPKSYVKLHSMYFDWDFDWSNQINIYLKTGGQEMRLGFTMEKYFIASKELGNIPILNKSGWICR